MVFLDLGAASYKVTVVGFNSVVGKKNKTQGAMSVKGIAWDETLGGKWHVTSVHPHVIRGTW